MRMLNQAIKYKPNYAAAYIKRGDLFIKMEEYNEAINNYHTASEYDSSGNNVQAKLEDAKAKAKAAKRKDYYKILSVDKGAGDAMIKKAYKKAALKWHPDKNSHSEEAKAKAEKMFREVNEAQEVLLDSKKRALYDEGHDLEDINSGKAGGMGGFGGGVDPSDIFQMFMGGGMGGMRGGRGGRGGGRGGMPGGFSQ